MPQRSHCPYTLKRKTRTMTTKHDHAPNFGRHVDGCPRCAELKAGAAPVVWAWNSRQREEAARLAAIRAHDCKASRCGPVCTAFDW